MLRLFALILITTCASSLSAQSKVTTYDSTYELFAGYSANGYFVAESPVSASNQNVSSLFNDRAGGPRGFNLSLARNFNRYLGLKGDFSTYFENLNGRNGTVCVGTACATGQAFNVPLRSLYFLAGPEFKLRNRSGILPFAHGLFGVVHSTAKFTITSANVNFSDSNSQTGFAAAFGGGLDFRINRAVGVRTTLDYVPTFLKQAAAGESGLQQHVRLAVGGVFRF
jgi:opacity protein-like surface antigen